MVYWVIAFKTSNGVVSLHLFFSYVFQAAYRKSPLDDLFFFSSFPGFLIFFPPFLYRFFPMKKRDHIMITMEMPGRTRATRSSSESIASAISMRIFILMNHFFTSLLILNGETQLMKSIYCTFHIMWTKWFQIASRNPTSLRSPQIGALAVSILSLFGRKWFKNWKGWVRSFYSLEDVGIGEGDFYISWILWDIWEREQLMWLLFTNSWWLVFSGDTFSERGNV